jgi:hypothetical protein
LIRYFAKGAKKLLNWLKLKPVSPKKPIVEPAVEESCISDGSSASDADFLSDGITTEHDSDFMV